MPIKGLSEQRRIPRLGKIHLGIKKKNPKGVEYPSATEYFVVPPEIAKHYGDTPTELPIMIPVEDEEYWASQYYRCYSRTRGLICKGDGDTCRRMVDTKTGGLASKDSKEVIWKVELPCEGRGCPHYQNKQCREVMNLQFMLPEIPGLGVWQIDTSSINSIRNINSSAELIRGICGHIRMLPLLLTLEKQEVINPDDGKKKNVCVLNLRHGSSLHSLLADSVKPVHELLAPPPDDMTEAPLDIIQDIKVNGGDISKPEVIEVVEQVSSSPEVETELDFDPEELKSMLAQAKWKNGTAISYCTQVYKVDKDGNPLDKSLDIIPFMASLSREDREKFIKEVQDRISMA